MSKQQFLANLDSKILNLKSYWSTIKYNYLWPASQTNVILRVVRNILTVGSFKEKTKALKSQSEIRNVGSSPSTGGAINSA